MSDILFFCCKDTTFLINKQNFIDFFYIKDNFFIKKFGYIKKLSYLCGRNHKHLIMLGIKK